MQAAQATSDHRSKGASLLSKVLTILLVGCSYCSRKLRRIRTVKHQFGQLQGIYEHVDKIVAMFHPGYRHHSSSRRRVNINEAASLGSITQDDKTITLNFAKSMGQRSSVKLRRFFRVVLGSGSLALPDLIAYEIRLRTEWRCCTVL
jgi:hypothetical protein